MSSMPPISDENPIAAGLNHERRGDDVAGRSISGSDLHERHDREHEQHHDLDCEQKALQYRRYLDAPIADVGHEDYPDDTHEEHPVSSLRWSRSSRVEQQEDVLPCDLGEARHDQDVGGDDRPSPVPTRLRAEGARRPRERRPAVGVGLVHLAVADRDEKHRYEGQYHDQPAR